MSEAAVSSVEVTRPKSPTISFINSNKGKSLLVANNYVFKLNKTTTTTNDGAISAMEYLDGLSFTVAKQKK
ncbi:unnamed protein product [Rotaria sordida]|uniref:Uncharacterized protein n=1 Tax=Rotaria sordida TaxID=392033 RepID=A0A814SEM8_9BILA|nr:unnamed protein product [Rotaria sordida]CAF1147058.1 unnamed protein product [Rotaria sordida]CAF1148536.1 unnamed protein product [Rotaria sordida]CAF1324578.1 unnamed protein product [Rotaria sordida]CAF1354950.1 unnamed protein product [Rotaria sordida]